MNGAMETIFLPQKTVLEVRKDYLRFAPLELGQAHMVYLISVTPPSIQSRLVFYQYSRYLNNGFNMMESATEAILLNLDIEFFWPEQSYVNIHDKNVDRLYIIGQGLSFVARHYGYVPRVIVGEVGEGTIINVPQFLYGSDPIYSVTCRTHSIATYLLFERLNKIMIKFQDTKQKLEDFVLNNPYDPDRDYFIKIARRSVDFLKRVNTTVLNKIYQESEQKYFEINQKIFEVGDKI